MPEIHDLRLFPLGTVLFPNQLLPLRIFEERYKLMIEECLDEKAPFGVVLIKEGREVGGLAVPYQIGTSARIAGMQPLGQGRMHLKTVGDQPFRLVEITEKVPYMKGRVEYLSYERGLAGDRGALAATVRDRFSVHLDILSNLSEQPRPDLDLDVDPESLSYLVGGIMAIQMPEKQQLLEMTQADQRLRAESSILSRENRALQAFMYLKDQQKKAPSGDDLEGRISLN